MKIDPIIPIWLMAVISLAIIALKRKGIVPYIRQIIIAILLFVINLRIMVPNGDFETQTIETNAYVIFVVDNTVSMYANDYNSEGMTRREAIQQDCAYIIEGLPGAHFSTISFGNSATLVSPLTPNGSYESSIINSLKPVDYYYATGTSLNIPHDLLLSELKDIDENYDGAYVTVFFLTDGENTSDEDQMDYTDLADYIDDGAVLGYGTTSGGTMEITSDYDGSVTTITDEDGGDGISKMDESNMKQLAKDLGLDYIHMTSSGKIDSTLNSIEKSVSEIGELSKTIKDYDDIYYWFAIPLALLLGWEVVSMSHSAANRKRKKGEVSADEPQA